jgi:dienelactone hydrolase
MVAYAVEIAVNGGSLTGDLTVPTDAGGVVVFAHGSGSGRRSPRNRQVADGLHRAGLATLLVDLLTPAEEAVDRRTAELRFDIPLLGHRLTAATDALRRNERLAGLPLGLFGASTGAAAALLTAADRPDDVRAVVSRGGRPDLAADRLADVVAAVLLVVGGHDDVVLRLNRSAAARLAMAEIAVVPGASHLFEEPGALERVTDLAAGWFARWLGP